MLFGVLGDVFAGGEAAGAVWRFRLDGSSMGRYVESADDEAGVTGLALGLDGHLMVADGRRGRIVKHDGFALAWARLGVAGAIDPDQTNDRLAAGVILPTAPPAPTEPSPTALPSVTPPPTTATPGPTPDERVLLPYVVRR